MTHDATQPPTPLRVLQNPQSPFPRFPELFRKRRCALVRENVHLRATGGVEVERPHRAAETPAQSPNGGARCPKMSETVRFPATRSRLSTPFSPCLRVSVVRPSFAPSHAFALDQSNCRTTATACSSFRRYSRAGMSMHPNRLRWGVLACVSSSTNCRSRSRPTRWTSATLLASRLR